MIKDENLIEETNEKVDPNDGVVENKETKSTSEKMKQSEFAYGAVPMGEAPKKLEPLPMDWKKQTIVSVSTTAISFLPVILKMYNNKKDPNMPRISYEDCIDILIYKIPDLYLLIEKLTKGSKIEQLITKGQILKIILPFIPTLKALLRHKKVAANGQFDYMLLAHVLTFAINTAIPQIATNPTIGYIYNNLFQGAGFNFLASLMMRSQNPLIRETAKTIPALDMLFNKFKYIKHSLAGAPQGGVEAQRTQYNSNSNTQQVPGKGLVDAVGNVLRTLGGPNPYYGGGVYYNTPYDYNYGYNSRGYQDPYYQRRPEVGNGLWT